jgi:hypothetical protein
MSDPSDPPRKFYDLKPREFERVNAPRPPPPEETAASPAPADVPRVDRGPIDVKELFRQAQMGGPVLSSEAKRKVDPNDVHAILQDNLARANAAGLNDVSLRPKRPSKRKRDYWIMMTAVSVVFGPIAVATGVQVAAGNRGSAMIFGCSLAALILIQITLWWVMWHIVDDYYE